VLAGFNKDHQAFLFVELGASRVGRDYIAELRPRIATNSSVAAFNEEFSSARRLCGGSDPASMAAVWVGASLTARGLEVLAPNALQEHAEGQVDTGIRAYIEGAASRANALGDTGTSDADHWRFGRPTQRIDAVITVAADRPDALALEVQRQRELATRHDANVVFEQHGSTLAGVRRGHEHFGFRDGISQPGVHGFDAASRSRPDEVADKPGVRLVAPGEFVLGYAGENGRSRVVPEWMADGSFVVIRRLAQDVPGWWGHLTHISAVSGQPIERLAARAVGRWRSGAPVAHDPATDPRQRQNAGHDNDFDYSNDRDAVHTASFAHIRSMNPRAASPSTHRQRLLRRGIPFGPHFDPAAGRGHGGDADRGLLFVSYQASIVEQFEVLYRRWHTGTRNEPGTGPSETRHDLSLTLRPYVRAQGGVYAFTPSLAALDALASGQLH
jgi:Dyp-type peroxidase family